MTKEEQAAIDVVMNFLAGYAKKDIDACMATIAVQKPILFFGTNENEIFNSADKVRAAFTKDFATMTHIRWGKPRQLNVNAAAALASVIIELPVSFRSEGKSVKTLFRYALTLTKAGKQWKICSGMASVPFSAGTYSF